MKLDVMDARVKPLEAVLTSDFGMQRYRCRIDRRSHCSGSVPLE